MMNNKNTIKLQLTYVGEDDWSRPTYKDQLGRLWKDLNLGECKSLDLCSVTNNEIDGEPCSQCQYEYEIETKAPDKSFQFEYGMLSRMQQDCNVHISTIRDGIGNRTISDDMKASHFAEMKELWNKVPKKPEWLTWNELVELEKEVMKYSS